MNILGLDDIVRDNNIDTVTEYKLNYKDVCRVLEIECNEEKGYISEYYFYYLAINHSKNHIGNMIRNNMLNLVKEVYNNLYGFSAEDEFIYIFLKKPENIERFIKYVDKNQTKTIS